MTSSINLAVPAVEKNVEGTNAPTDAAITTPIGTSPQHFEDTLQHHERLQNNTATSNAAQNADSLELPADDDQDVSVANPSPHPPINSPSVSAPRPFVQHQLVTAVPQVASDSTDPPPAPGLVALEVEGGQSSEEVTHADLPQTPKRTPIVGQGSVPAETAPQGSAVIGENQSHIDAIAIDSNSATPVSGRAEPTRPDHASQPEGQTVNASRPDRPIPAATPTNSQRPNPPAPEPGQTTDTPTDIAQTRSDRANSPANPVRTVDGNPVRTVDGNRSHTHVDTEMVESNTAVPDSGLGEITPTDVSDQTSGPEGQTGNASRPDRPIPADTSTNPLRQNRLAHAPDLAGRTVSPEAAAESRAAAHVEANELLAKADLRRLSANGSRLGIDLTTTDLGPVRVEATTQGTELNLRLLADGSTARALINEHLEELRAQFSAEGVDVSSVSVDVDDDRAERQGTASPESQAAEPSAQETQSEPADPRPQHSHAGQRTDALSGVDVRL